MKTTTEQPCCKWNLQRLFILICTTLVSTLSFAQAGNAPMQTLPSFPGNFAIDGFLQRQGVNGDWLPAAGGSANNFVMNNAGTVVVPLGFHLLDLFNDQVSDDIFDGGNKLFQNPNVWGWRSQKPPAKDDINNATAFIALNPANNHIWLAISGDRMSTNGTSYLDFEFYQNPITKIGGPTTGGFSSTGPHNGRTVGDISLTLQYTAGGSFAEVFYLQWQPGAEAGSYDYFPITPPAGTAFAAANGGVADINVPYGAFNETVYHTLQFAEGAIDLTGLIGGTGLPGECGSLPFKSLFIKSKSSAETTADLKDFISPISLSVCFDHTAPTISCPNTLNLGCNPTIPAPSGATASDNCDGSVIPVASDGPVQSTGCSRTMNRTWIATDDCGNMNSCIQIINWTEDHTAPVFTGSFANVDLGCNPANPSGSLGSAGASDACGAPTLAISDGSVSSNGCSRSQTRTFRANDACGNTSSASRTVSWTVDNTPPAFTGSYADVNLGCNPANPDGSLGSATATDGCGAVTISSSDGAIGSDGCNRSRTRTFTARDACNNTATTSRTVRWIADLTPPTFTGSYADVTLGCNPADPAGSLGTATATDACGAVTITSTDGSVVSDGCNRSVTRTFTARDGCNNTSTTSRTVRWISDLTPPGFTSAFTQIDLGCINGTTGVSAQLGEATATDACSIPTVTSSDGNVQSNGCSRTATRTFTARDACGNTATATRIVTFTNDPTPPVFTGSYADVNLGCNPANPDGSLGSATATDGCSNPTITSSDGAVVSDGCNRSRTRTFTARDACNNTSTTSRTVRWISDNTPPAFTGSYADVNLGCNPANPDGSLGSASATDVCGAVTITSSDGAVVSDGCNRSRTRTFTATDGCLNTSTTSRTVRWIADLTPPAFTGSYADVNLGCNPANPDGSLGSASATDVCGAVTITSSDGAVISDGCNRSRTRTFTATDGCLNTSTTSRTVRWIADLTPPAFTGSYADVNLGCNPANPDGSLGSASATDVCGAVTITQSDGAVVSTGCNRARTRTFTATDGCLNTSTTSRTVRWIADLTPPAFTGSYADVNLGCNPANPDGSLGSASATDVCGAVTITQTDGAVVSTGCNRARTRTFTATDGCLNTSTTSRTVRWIADLTPPAFTGSYADVNLGCNPANPDGSLGNASATDVCGAVTITQTDGAVISDGCNRSRTRTFTATDGCLNTSTTSRTVRWIADLTPPAFTGNYADVNLGCNPANPDGSLGSASATDVCGAVTITSSDGAVISDGCNRSRTRTFTATDGCLNTSTTSRTVRWIADLTPPAFTGSYADVNLGCNPANPDGSLGSASATDVCGAVTITQSDGAVVSTGCNRARTRTFTATDGCLNTSTTSRTVRWIADLTPPAFTGSYADVNLGCNPANPDGSLGSASATDVCGAVTITQTDGAVISDGCNRSRTRTFTATDGCLNTSTTSRTVRWIADLTPPAFTGSYADVNLGCNPANPDGSLGSASATDICGAVTITSADGAVVSDGCNRSKTRTFTATDGCLNTSTTSRTVRWIADLTPPAFTGSYADVNLGCNPANPDGSLGSASATDVCGAVTITQSDGAVVSNGCNRSRTRTFTATDGCLNTSSTSRTVRWIADLTPPAFTGSYADVNLGCNPANPDGSLGSASATDVCGAVTITSSDGAVVSDGCNRSRTRTFTATDGCLNTSTTSRTVRWIADLTPPAFTGSYADVNLGCNPANPDGSLGSASATDVCGAVTITQSDGAVVSDGCNRSRTRTFTATDGCLNTSTTSRTVRWIADVTPPSFTGSYADVNLGCNPANPDGSLGAATATDVCGAVTITSSDGAVVSNGCNRSRTRTFTATDGCLNTSSTSRTVRWIADLTPPAFTGSYADVSLGCNPANPDGSLGSASATDICGAVTITQSDGAVVSSGCNRSRTRTFTATDGCLNTSTTSRTVRWIADLTPPTFTSTPASVDLNCADAIPGVVAPTASDACSTPTVIMTGSTDNPANCSTGFQRIITRSWKATDGCGNTATFTQTIRVKCCLPVCTLTQGAYGNPGGNICLPDGTTVNQTQIMIDALNAEDGDSVVFGRKSNNRYWVIKLIDVNQGNSSNIFNMLPGGSWQGDVFGLDTYNGAPQYNNAASWPVVPLQPSGSKKGNIRNQLFAQTLTFYFNTKIAGNGLGDVSFNGDSVIVQGRQCGNPNPVGTKDTISVISPAIVSYMSSHGYPATAAGILQLANDALGGVNISPLTVQDVHGLVGGLNETFDECRMVVGYVPVASGGGRLASPVSNVNAGPALAVTAFPNPYEENFSLRINSPVSGQASISFYTMDGVKIGEMKRDVVEKKDVWVPYNVPAAYRTRIVYTVNVGSYNAKGVVLSPN